MIFRTPWMKVDNIAPGFGGRRASFFEFATLVGIVEFFGICPFIDFSRFFAVPVFNVAIVAYWRRHVAWYGGCERTASPS